MTKKMKRIIVSILTLLLGVVLCACGEVGSNKKNYSLNETSISMGVGETKMLTVNEENIPYDGIISWVSDNVGVVTVYQGIVKGVKQGEAKVKAILKEVDTTLEVTVTVNSVVEADLGLINAYSGGGNVKITATSAELPVGAKATIAKITAEDGTDVTSRLTTTTKDAFITNTNEEPLASGFYTVNYNVVTPDATGTVVRTVRLVDAKTYNDLFVLDPVDGTEPIKGKVLEYAWEPSYAQLRDNPGEYVTYEENGNTGYTEENGINQNASEFKETLRKAGYTGTVDNTTVYRMYTKITTTAGKIPFMAFNLPFTGGDVWTNLNDFSDTATIDLWVRGWFKEKGSDEFKLNCPGGAYAYKVMAEGWSALSATTGYTVTYCEGGWTKISYSIATNRELLNGAKNLAFTGNMAYLHKNGTTQRALGEAYYEVYAVEINPGENYDTLMGTVQTDVTGRFSGLFDNCELSVYDSNNKKLTGFDYTTSEDGSTLTMKKKDSYTLKYLLKKGDKVFDTVERKFNMGVLLSLQDKFQMSTHAWQSATVSNSTNGENPVGKPVSTYDKDGYLYMNSSMAQGSYGFVRPVFNLTKLFENLDQFKDEDYIGIWVYCTNDIQYSMFYVSQGGPHLGTGENTSAGAAVSVTGGKNEWTQLKITVGELRAEMATAKNQNANFDTLCISLRTPERDKTTEELIQNTVYFYAVEFFIA